MQIHARFLAVALAALPLAGCGADAALSPEDSMFVATIQGSVQGTYRGTGQFNSSSPDGVWPGMFTIYSADRASGQTFSLFREGPQLPQSGSYPLAWYAAGPVRFGAIYTRRKADGSVEGFAATSGELQIVTARAGRIKGTFRLQGTRNCAGTTLRLSCTYPLNPAEPSVEISGSFVVTDNGPVPLPF